MNYANTIQKCITELKAEKPRLDYVLGMLEVLAEMSDKPTVVSTHQIYETKPTFIRTETVSDEEAIPDFLKAGPRATTGA